MEICTKIKRYYQENGRQQFILRCLRPFRRLKRSTWTTREYYIFKNDISETPPPHQYDDVEFKQMTKDMIGEIVPQLISQYGRETEDVIRNWITRGDISIVGLDPSTNKKMMCICWVSTQDELLKVFRGKSLKKIEICARRIYVPNEYRRKELASRGLAFLNWIALQKGYKTMWAFVETQNTASQKMFKSKTNFISYGYLKTEYKLGRKFVSVCRLSSYSE